MKVFSGKELIGFITLTTDYPNGSRIAFPHKYGVSYKAIPSRNFIKYEMIVNTLPDGEKVLFSPYAQWRCEEIEGFTPWHM